MSRLESNAEPSMEEILASIRKIIAEDSSGMRPSAASPKPGIPYSPAAKSVTPQPTPAPAPQRGFMTREAFLKSSQLGEPEPQESFAPVGAQRPVSGESQNAAPRARARDEDPLFEKPSSFLRNKESAPTETSRAREDARKDPVLPTRSDFPSAATERSQPNKPDSPTTSLSRSYSEPSAAPETDDAETIETIEVVAIEDVLPVFDASAPSVLNAEPDPAAKSAGRSNTSSIDAQLSELLSEDLNALRQGRAKAQAEENAAKPSGTTKSERPETFSDHAAQSEDSEDTATTVESSDPFAFDLGPSPFASNSESQSAAPTAPDKAKGEAEPVTAPTSVAKSPPSESSPSEYAAPAPALEMKSTSTVSPGASFQREPVSAAKPSAQPTPAGARPVAVEASDTKSAPANAAPTSVPYFGPFVPPTATSGASAPSANAAPPQSEHEAAAPRARQAFAVPSVSATLGPSRKLEPLSNAFEPAPPPPPRAMEMFSPAAESEPERQRSLEPPRASSSPARAPEANAAAPPPSQQYGEGDRLDEAILRSALPATTSESSLDRPMEDAVADLLRPLLKTWLAENMPKIVERALRREMSERLLPGQKNTRD